jgi:hypothetical protein
MHGDNICPKYSSELWWGGEGAGVWRIVSVEAESP